MAIIKPEQLASGSYNITGSLFGTASTASYYSGSVTSASYALTSSYALNSGVTINTGSFLITSSLEENSIVFTKGSGEQYSVNLSTITSATASYVQNAQTASYITLAQTASYYGGSVTSASFASSGTGIFSGSFSGSFTGDGSLLTNLSFALGNVLFVSPSGSDVDTTRAGHIGNPNKPFLTLNAAKTAAISGDLIYVLPNYFIFDNSAGIYDSNIEYLNLWKDGVTYYWSPGCKLKFIASVSNVSSYMVLFRPSLTVYETCKSVGYLEYEQYAAISSLGKCNFFIYADVNNTGTTTGTDYGCTFYSQTKSQVGYGNTLIGLQRGNSTNTSSIMDITIISDYESNTWVSGHSGGSFTYSLSDSSVSDCPITFRSIVRDRDNSNNSFLTIRNMWGPSSYVYFGGETLRQNGYTTGSKFFEPRITSTITINIDIKKMYTSTTNTTLNGLTVNDQFNVGSLGTIFNIKGDFIASYASGVTTPLITLSYNTTVNYDGNIYTNTNSGAGNNSILSANNSTSLINMRGNIVYLGTIANTNHTFKTTSGGTIKYSGNVSGNYANILASCGTGVIEINNSNIKSAITGSTSYIASNGGTTLGTVKINNSYIELSNISNPISNGNYVKHIINNSTIINSNTSGSGLSNAGSDGTLNLINSTIIATSSSINYPSGSTVIMANAVVSSPYIISNPVGDINIVTDIQF